MESLFPMAELAARWGVTPNTVSRRISYLGIKPIRQGNFRYLTAADLELAEQLQQHVLSGKPMEAFPRPDGETTAMVTRQKQKDDPTAALVAAMAAQLKPPTDPLVAARRLKEAADLGVWLSNVEMAETLGVADTTMRNYQDGHCPRPDFKLEKLKDGGGLIWWRVIHLAGTVSALPATSRRVGFSGAIEASYETLNSVALPYFSC